MMNDEMEQFENRLRRQSLRQIPAEWRAEILRDAVGTARCAVRGHRSAASLPNWQTALANLFWPHPKAWAGLAAVWICIFALNLSMRDKPPAVVEKALPPSPEVLVQLKQQREMFAQLIGANESRVADRQKVISPKPRSECMEITTV